MEKIFAYDPDCCDWNLKCPKGLLRKDMTPKKAYHELMNLIKKDWWTKGLRARTGPDGSCNFKCFYGDYRITVTKGTEKKIFYRKFKQKDGKTREINLKW